MAQPLLTNAAVMMPQEEAQGSVTPKPLQAPAPVPGGGLVPAKAASISPDSMPVSDRSRGPSEPEPIPMPKPNPVWAGGDSTPRPKPLMGAGAPSGSAGSSGQTAFGRPVEVGESGGGAFDWRSAVAQTDRGAVTRSVQDNELTSNQLSRLIDENGRYIQQARLGAREGAAARGMLTSSFAAGAAERAAIDAALPIAQSDANTYFSTSSENMRAQNEDAMADQGAGRSLLSQGESQRFQSSENAVNRSFQAAENAAGRGFQAEQSGIERDWRSLEAGRDRSQQYLMQERGFSFQEAQAAVERGWRSDEAERERGFSGQQNDLQRQQQRISEYNAMMTERERGFQNQLASIFSNTNLKPEEQARAVENARAVFSSTAASFNSAFAQGIPSIFMRPYEMQQPAPSTQPTTPVQPAAPASGLPAGATPIAGTNLYRDSGGVIRTIVAANAARG